MRSEFNTARWRRGLRLLVPALVLAAGLAATATESVAQSRVCRQLESQLAGVSRGGGESSGQARRYDRAIEQQRAQLAKGERQYRRAGCGGGLFWRDNGGAACDSIGRGLDRMERNLAQLERTRARMGGAGGDPRRERARILASLDANDCGVVRQDRRQPDVVARQDNRGLFDQLFGGSVRRATPREEREVPAYDASARVRTTIGGDHGSIQSFGNGGGGSYRTLCVRTCDGYYWPISYSSSQGDFQRDEQNCQTMCPGTEVKLFSHRVPDEDSENMVDAYGSPYTDLTTAFKYRDVNFSRPQGCSCTAAKKNFSVIAGDGATAPTETEAPSIALPVARPDPAADPETLANRGGSFDTDDMRRLSEAKGVATSADADRKVRVVGPAYLPDPEAAAGPQAPGPTAIQ